MGLLDKAKASATAAMAQGQAKVGAFQQGRSETELYKALGEAFYREQRQGGDHQATVDALVALDTHMAQAAQAAAAQPAPYQAPPAQGAPYQPPPGQPYTPPAASGPPAATPGGNFTLDDM